MQSEIMNDRVLQKIKNLKKDQKEEKKKNLGKDNQE
jgi:hypothetical protein